MIDAPASIDADRRFDTTDEILRALSLAQSLRKCRNVQFSAGRTEGLIYFSYFSDAATCLGAILLGPGQVVLTDAVLGACGAVNHAVAALRRFAD